MPTPIRAGDIANRDIHVRATPKEVEQLDQIRQWLGVRSQSDAIRWCIRQGAEAAGLMEGA